MQASTFACSDEQMVSVRKRNRPNVGSHSGQQHAAHVVVDVQVGNVPADAPVCEGAQDNDRCAGTTRASLRIRQRRPCVSTDKQAGKHQHMQPVNVLKPASASGLPNEVRPSPALPNPNINPCTDQQPLPTNTVLHSVESTKASKVEENDLHEFKRLRVVDF